MSLACVGSVPADISSTNHPFPGVTYYAETRTQPPTRMFVAEIDLANPNVRLRVSRGGPDPDGAGPWQTTLLQPTKIAAREGFDLVVNGDFFRVPATNAPERTLLLGTNWSAVSGPAVTDGELWALSAAPRPCLVVRKHGQVAFKNLGRPEADDWQVVAGNTMLVRDGVAVVQDNKVRHPRTVVGLNAAADKLVILVVDGRKPGVAVGMSYDELAVEMLRLGCHQALNLDGGGSSVLAVRDPVKNEFKILNAPTDGRERAVANALGIVLRRTP